MCVTDATIRERNKKIIFKRAAKYIRIPVGGIITDMHFICRSIVRLCGRISPLLSRDISVLVRRYLCLGPKISPPVGFIPQLIPPTGIRMYSNICITLSFNLNLIGCLTQEGDPFLQRL